ncbi:MAG: hypothetical protein IJ799_05605 [Bacteroidales bacterium]|nr:hypothetical protein [Bacteroidales bacterium]
MKRLFCIMTALLLGWTASVSAQESKIPQRLELAVVEQENTGERVEVFNSPKDGVNRYYLSVGKLGFGDKVLQVYFDPLFELFIPLGENLTDVLEKLNELKALCKAPVDSAVEWQGCLAFGFPNDKLEKVTITHKKVLLGHSLAFSVEREGYIRMTYVSKSDISSLTGSIKFYSKLHPKER